MAVRQESASGNGKLKKPRIQVVLPERLNGQVEELAKQRGESVSATTRWIIERHFENPSSRPEGNYELKKEELTEDAEFMKFAKMFKAFKAMNEAGVI